MVRNFSSSLYKDNIGEKSKCYIFQKYLQFTFFRKIKGEEQKQGLQIFSLKANNFKKILGEDSSSNS